MLKAVNVRLYPNKEQEQIISSQNHASILIDIEEKITPNTKGSFVGIDVGVSLVVADSNGRKVKPLDLLRELSKLRTKAQQLSHKKKNSNNSVKAKAKRGLNRVITWQSWGLFFELLEYKLNERGGQLIKVDPKFTSQTCKVCGHISKENRQS